MNQTSGVFRVARNLLHLALPPSSSKPCLGTRTNHHPRIMVSVAGYDFVEAAKGYDGLPHMVSLSC
jgi:hypothetical protein